jgi:hypothetical protein
MQVPNAKTPITRCETAAKYAVAALRRYPALFGTPTDATAKLGALADSLENGTTALLGSQAAYRAGVIDLIPRRVEVRLVDLKSDDVVRSAQRAAEEVGPGLASDVFPGGVTPIVKPVGQTEVDAMRALEGRIAAATSWTAREAVLASVQAARVEYETALTNRKNGMTAAADRRAARDVTKEDFLDVFAAVAAGVKGVFPRDAARQNVFFDELREPRTADDETDEPDEPVAG